MFIKDFQPIKFKICDDSSSCDCGNHSCNQLALFSDKFSFQFANSELFIQSDTILNGDFATNDLTGWSEYDNGGQSWSGATGSACVQGNPQSKVLYQAQTISECECYKLKFDLLTDLPDGCELDIILDDGTDSWDDIIATYEDIEADTDIVLNFCADDDYTRIGFRFSGTECGESTKCLDNISLQGYDITINIVSCCDDVVIDQVDICDIFFYEECVNVVGLWSDYVSEKGCYKFQVEDVEFIDNGTFDTDLTGWEDSGSDWEWNAGTAYVAPQGSTFISSILTQTFDEPLYFTCQKQLSFFIGGNSVPTNLYINGEIVETYNSGIDTKTYDLPLNTKINSIGFAITVQPLPIGGSIDNVSIQTDIDSYCLCLDETHPFCTLLVTGSNSIDTADFDFESDSDFELSIRLWSRLVNPRYPDDVDIYLSSFGVNTMIYSRNEKVWEWQIERIPEYMWDAIQTIVNLDEFNINGVQYIKASGEIQPDWTRSNTQKASGTLEVQKQTEDRGYN